MNHGWEFSGEKLCNPVREIQPLAPGFIPGTAGSNKSQVPPGTIVLMTTRSQSHTKESTESHGGKRLTTLSEILGPPIVETNGGTSLGSASGFGRSVSKSISAFSVPLWRNFLSVTRGRQDRVHPKSRQGRLF